MEYTTYQEYKYQNLKPNWLDFIGIRLYTLGFFVITLWLCIYLPLEQMFDQNVVKNDDEQLIDLKMTQILLSKLENLDIGSYNENILLQAQTELLLATKKLSKKHKDYTSLDKIKYSFGIKQQVLKIQKQLNINDEELLSEIQTDFLTLGQMLIEEKQYQNAIQLLDSAIILFPDDEKILFLKQRILDTYRENFSEQNGE